MENKVIISAKLCILFMFNKHDAKCLVAELTSPHPQSACGFRGERVRTVGLVTCCNYLLKKKNTRQPRVL